MEGKTFAQEKIFSIQRKGLDKIVIGWFRTEPVTTVGANRLIHMDTPVKSDRLRIRFEAPVALCVSEIGIYKMK